MNSHIFIKNVLDIEELSKLSLSDSRTIHLIPIPEQHEEARRLEERFNRATSSCGCETGAITLFVTAFLWILYIAFNFRQISLFWTGAVAVGSSIVAVIAGKVFGVLWARSIAHQTLKQIHVYYESVATVPTALDKSTLEKF